MTEATVDTTTATTAADTTTAAATTTTATTTAATTAADATTTADTNKPPPAKWRDDWRTAMVGALPETATPAEKESHGKLMKRLERFNSPEDVAKSWRALEIKMAAGELKAPLAQDATPEQIAAYRKDNGIPDTPDKYDLGLPKGTVLGESDKKVVDAWVAKVHGANASPEVVKAGTAAYLAIRDEMAQEMAEVNEAAKEHVAETLMAEWGTDYKSNVAGVKSLLGQAETPVMEALMSARGADGIALMNKPEVVKWFAGHARELGFVGATVVPQGGDLGKSIDDEIKSIEDSMFNKDGTRNSAYWGSDKAQTRYSQLLQTRERRGKEK
jgi:hypothetical protein